MVFADPGPSVRSIAEFVLVVSRRATGMHSPEVTPTVARLRSFWQNSRRLQRRWMIVLDEASQRGPARIEILEQLAPRVFVCEMLVRMWGTILASVDVRQGTEDLTTIARNVVNGIVQIRIRLLRALLDAPSSEHDRVLHIDRLRRKFDRWTDLFLGPIAVESECFEFTIDADRAREFGEDSRTDVTVKRSNVVEHFISAGARSMFFPLLSDELLEESEFAGLMRSLLPCLALA
jgi:hypothetical protein